MKRILVYPLLALIVFLSACQDMKNPDDVAYVLSLGVDAGEERRFSFTVQIPSQTAQAAEKEGFTLHSAEADGIFEAIDKINAALPWRLTFVHLNDIIIGESLAAGGCLKELIRLVPNSLGFRATCRIAVAKGKAGDFLAGMRGLGEINPVKHQRAWMLEPSESALFPECTYAGLAESLTSPIHTAILPLGGRLPGVGGESDGITGMLGCVLVQDGIAALEFGANETLALMLARGEFRRGWYYAEHAALLRLAKPREVRVLSREPLVLSLSVYVELTSESFLDAAKAVNAERLAAESLRGELASVFESCRAAGADAFELGKHVVTGFSTNAPWNAFNWSERIREARLDINVECERGV